MTCFKCCAMPTYAVRLDRPLSRLVSWLVPAAQVAKVNRNPLYPELQQEWDEDPLNFQASDDHA